MTYWKPQPNSPIYAIGIDTGVNTGFAVWDCQKKQFHTIKTLQIHEAMEIVSQMHALQQVKIVRVEDARQRKWFGADANNKKQGAGSVKRDAKIWEDFLKDKKIPFEMVAPKNNKTKMKAPQFKSLTKYSGLTSDHSRDAAMLVWGM